VVEQVANRQKDCKVRSLDAVVKEAGVRMELATAAGPAAVVARTDYADVSILAN
jgi:hypothetical protein